MNSVLKPAVTFVAIGLLVSWCASSTTNTITTVAENSAHKPHKRTRHRSPPGSDCALQRSSRRHFSVEADVNGTSVRMVVDTGASTVVLTEADAEDIGLKTDALSYDATIRTANGSTSAAV